MIDSRDIAQAHSVYISLLLHAHTESSQLRQLLSSAPRVPHTFDEAMTTPEWRHAIAAELRAHDENGTWKYVLPPPDAKLIGSKYVFRVKLKADGSIDKYKARLTAQGFSQIEGVNYNVNGDNTFAPVLAYTTLRLVMAIANALDYEIDHLDVETAFLNAHVEEDIYMKPPAGVDAPPGHVCKLNKALYGIKQAPHAWHADIAATLIHTLGYRPSPHDSCLFLKVSRNGLIMLFPLYVDDSFPAYASIDREEMQQDKHRLMSIYKIKDLGAASHVLGMRVTRDRSARILKLDQQAYIERMLEQFGASHAKPSPTPELSTESSIDASSSPSSSSNSASSKTPCEGDSIDTHISYATLVGMLQYAALGTRPDIAHAVHSLARGLTHPTIANRQAAWRLLRYLFGTSHLGLTFSGEKTKDAPRSLIAYSDANWAGRGGDNDGKSTSGWIVKLGSGPLSWSSRKQSMVATSSTESEYVAASLATQELIWIRALLQDCGFIADRPTPLLCDNRAAISLAHKPNITARSKHINVRYHQIRHEVRMGTIRIGWIRSSEQPADALTKALGPQVFTRLLPFLLGHEYEPSSTPSPSITRHHTHETHYNIRSNIMYECLENEENDEESSI
jgi:hypothetical protein